MLTPRIRNSLFIILGLILGWIASWYWYTFISPTWFSPQGPPISVVSDPRPLDAFTFENLASREYFPAPVTISERTTSPTIGYKSYTFQYQSDDKTVSGLATVPFTTNPEQKFPVIVMLRGYVDPEIYQTGVGTWRAAEIFAKNGFLTLAPDFLGFGQSDLPEDNIFWERFNKPVQVLNLIASIPNFPQADLERIGLWGHSNGGHIALSVLEITRATYPTTLWAPVTKPFPYSILFYTDEYDDYGQRLRIELARLESEYDVRKYSLSNYLNYLHAPLQLHQGTLDDAVPLEWSNAFVASLKNLDKSVSYYVYPGADHNLRGSWDTVVQRDLEFFKQHL